MRMRLFIIYLFIYSQQFAIHYYCYLFILLSVN